MERAAPVVARQCSIDVVLLSGKYALCLLSPADIPFVLLFRISSCIRQIRFIFFKSGSDSFCLIVSY